MLENYFKQSRDIQKLYSMKQRELDDIGITVGDIIQFEKENRLFTRLKIYLRSKLLNFGLRGSERVDIL